VSIEHGASVLTCAMREFKHVHVAECGIHGCAARAGEPFGDRHDRPASVGAAVKDQYTLAPGRPEVPYYS